MPDKKTLRILARENRARLVRADFAQRLAEHASELKLAPGGIVAGYHAHKDEADPKLLLKVLAANGAHIAFPRTVDQGTALRFHLVPDGEILKPGRYGIHEPLEHWPEATPQTILVPLLAYDDRGYRLGYGGGYYDRTLECFPEARAIGIAYSGQRMDVLPHELHDFRLHAIMTEKGLEEFPP